MAERTGDDHDDETTPPPAESELSAAVDDALEDEVKRQKARFVQRILGLDRVEGVGRVEEHRERLERDDVDRRDDQPD
jgi:hypothetical protein